MPLAAFIACPDLDITDYYLHRYMWNYLNT